MSQQLRYYEAGNGYLLKTNKELKKSKDSADIVINNLTKDIKNKTKVVYIKQEVEVRDTFKIISIDTCYYNLNKNYELTICIEDSTLTHHIEFNNDLVITDYTTKERVGFKKTWIGKLFQKRVKVTNVEIRQTNELIKNKDIIKYEIWK
jgi:hypothetical protein